MHTAANRRADFRKLHEAGFFLIPNAWDAGSAKLLTALGFKAIASTSGGMALAAGKRDGEMERDDVLAALRAIVAATHLPVNADFEKGFADDPEELGRNVALAIGTGIAALSIEDWSGDHMYDTTLAAERIVAARAAIDAIDPRTVLVGRNEHFRVPAMAIEESIARAVAYAAAGADCLFVPGIFDHGAIAELVAAVAPKPVNVMIYRFDNDIAEYARIGVRRCSVGATLAQCAWDAADQAARMLKSFEP